MVKEQVKFYVTDEEKKRLDTLAKLRFMTVPNYVKTTALGVQIRQVKEVFIEKENEDFHYPETKERLIDNTDKFLDDEDKAVLEELLQRSSSKGFIQYDAMFNERLQQMATKLLAR